MNTLGKVQLGTDFIFDESPKKGKRHAFAVVLCEPCCIKGIEYIIYIITYV